MKIIIAFLAVCGLCSCHKTVMQVYLPGSWNFKSKSYRVNFCEVYDSSVIAFDSIAGSPFPNIEVAFLNKIPATSGTYHAASNGSESLDHVSIRLGIQTADSLTYYFSTGIDTSEKVKIAVANGKINISATGIEMLNSAINTDSSSLSFNITQTQ